MHATAEAPIDARFHLEAAMRFDRVAPVGPRASGRLASLSDVELLANTARLAGTSNQIFAALLEHLAEVDARGLHRTRACSSLYTYCIYDLRFSEDAAARRSAAAKLVRRFPAVLSAVAAGEIHLTGLLMLGPHLTDDNHVEVLSRAKFRTKKEIATLVRRLAPLPVVPDRVEPIGPAPSGPPRNATWPEFVESLCPSVRELPVGKRPRDWVDPASVALGSPTGDSAEWVHLDAEWHRTSSPGVLVAPPARDSFSSETLSDDSSSDEPLSDEPSSIELPLEPSPSESPSSAESTALVRFKETPTLYEVHFTTTEEHAELIERAQALLSHRSPKLSLGEVHRRALRLLVEALEKDRFGSSRVARTTTGAATASEGTREQLPIDGENATKPKLRAETDPEPRRPSRAPQGVEPAPRQRGRSIPAKVRRAVFERDEGQCAYVDGRGVRCRETHDLELHHLEPFALGGVHRVENLALRCRAHNALAAEEDFGRAWIERRREGAPRPSRSRPCGERRHVEAGLSFPRAARG